MNLITFIFSVITSPVFAARVTANFDKPLQVWDGFGVNYVETSETRGYNMDWPSKQIVDSLNLLRRTLETNGLEDVGLGPGESTHWYRFRPIAEAILANDGALKNLSLVTSHGFIGSSDPESHWNTPNPYDNLPIRKLRAKRTELGVAVFEWRDCPRTPGREGTWSPSAPPRLRGGEKRRVTRSRLEEPLECRAVYVAPPSAGLITLQRGLFSGRCPELY